ncbi:MAG: monofunctional biosynthetic peptidoglycan transglycosylase [Acidobacteria bacterium]|nr:monofunctional biosynthetic peptidoglycan transglycosylase [Acidobacteriota bacterium]
MKKATTPTAGGGTRLRRLSRRIALLVAAAAGVTLVVSVLVVVALRWISPPTTAFMLQHQIVAGRSGGAEAETGVGYRWVDWADMNPELGVAVVAAEDQRFLEHHGLDFEAISDALEERAGSGRLRGASTLSQQVAKNLFLWPGQSWVRKGIESYLTVLIELVWSKRRVLEVYLNVAEFGTGVYGVGAASERFFAREPARVDRHQAALLAAVLPSPKRLLVARPSPYVRSRQEWILAQMEQLGGVGLLEGLR